MTNAALKAMGIVPDMKHGWWYIEGQPRLRFKLNPKDDQMMVLCKMWGAAATLGAESGRSALQQEFKHLLGL